MFQEWSHFSKIVMEYMGFSKLSSTKLPILPGCITLMQLGLRLVQGNHPAS